MVAILEQIPLSQYTTIHTGGAARYFASCKNESELIDALRYAKSNHLKILVLGGGSNMLVRDQGFNGLVIKIDLNGVTINPDGTVEAFAGENWDTFVETCCNQGLSGVETLSGIPGSVGATPVQNVGAYGQEVCNTITEVRAICRHTMAAKTFTNSECKFSYRNSFFKETEQNKWVITKVKFQLSREELPEIKYEELQRALNQNLFWRSLPLSNQLLFVRETVIQIRSRKGMVLNPADTDSRSLGSFFVNPIVNDEQKNNVFAKANSLGLPTSPVAHGISHQKWKLSAAWLIENSGIPKGFTLGHARISTKHVLAITNPKCATTTEVLALADYVKTKVRQQFGIKLEQEPILI